MKYAWIEETTGNGQVTKLNQGATEPNEKEGTITPQQLTVLPQEYNMSAKMYEVVNLQFQAKSQAARDVLIDKDEREAIVQLRNEQREEEYDRRLSLVDEGVSPEKKRKNIFKQMKALRRESKGTASQSDTDFLDARDAMDSQLDFLDSRNDVFELYIEDPVRTQVELDELDVTADIWWT